MHGCLCCRILFVESGSYKHAAQSPEKLPELPGFLLQRLCDVTSASWIPSSDCGAGLRFCLLVVEVCWGPDRASCVTWSDASDSWYADAVATWRHLADGAMEASMVVSEQTRDLWALSRDVFFCRVTLHQRYWQHRKP